MIMGAGLTATVMACCFAALIFTAIPADVILLAGVIVLLLGGVLDPAQALSGFSNEGLATVAMLFVVANGLTQTGVVNWLSDRLLGRPRNLSQAQLRLMLPVAGLSAFLNNTPVVAMMVPAVSDWAKRYKLPVSQLMMPLSYAAIIGGTCTLIGTSTNLVVNDMLHSHSGEALNVFDLAWIGVPCVAVVVVFVLLFSRRLLPTQGAEVASFEDERQYIVEMVVEPYSPLAGETIESAGLRNLPGLFLIEIERNERLLTAVAPSEMLCSGDHLIFAGNVDAVVDLQKIRGLKPAENQVFKLDGHRADRCLVEVVISNNFPLLGKTVKEGRFRNIYGAAIIAVARDGERLSGRVGDMELRPGDTVLLESDDEFEDRQRYSKDFLLVSRLNNSQNLRHEMRYFAALILLVTMTCVSMGWISMFKASVAAAAAMIIFRCTSIQAARRSIDWHILMVIGASIALGKAVEITGIAAWAGELVVSLADSSAYLCLALLFVVTAAFSALISNMAAAVLLFPVTVAVSELLGVDVTPFAVVLMLGASASFATPIGYQTNLMVYGPGGYHFNDFVRMGLPLTLIMGVVSVLLVPVFWPF